MPSYSLPGAGQPRPELPLEQINPHIKDLIANLPTVKFQEIVRDGQSTIVARMKVPTPTGHAFILRRLDTGAVSLTTMFRAAFPLATESQEKDESAWVKANYDLTGANKSGKTRFAGTWVSEETAQKIAPSYLLQDILAPLIEARPDPNIELRKSTRTQQETPVRQLPTPAPSKADVLSPTSTPSQSKRRREILPEPNPTPVAPPTTKTPAKPPSTSRGTPARMSTRRSLRMTSPAPSPVPKLVATPKTPRSPRKQPQQQVATPAGSDQTAVEEEEEAQISGPDMAHDIEEQKQLIEAFKAQREAQRAAAAAAADADAAMEEAPQAEDRKREREDEEEAPPAFKFKEPEEFAQDQERQIATNRRVRGFVEMTPQRRSLAWGLGAFAAAAAAVALVPNPWF